jgi:hypothetical protein
VHQGYVDCVRYFGEYVLSKSVDNRVVLWEPKQSPGTVAKGLIHFVRVRGAAWAKLCLVAAGCVLQGHIGA